MKVLVIEDEKIAAERLIDMIHQCDNTITVLGTLQTVAKSVEWFQNNRHPDLVFMDIQLADGISFEIFEQTGITVPVIFTTAFNEYALKAFKVNSIDYLLKPIDIDELAQAIKKFKSSPFHVHYQTEVFDTILRTITNKYKNKFMIKVGERIRVFKTGEIQCFYSMAKAVFLKNSEGHDYAVNYTLDQLEELLDPGEFFRINRGAIISFSSIADIISFSNSRLQVKLLKNTPDDLVVSRERVQEFKKWLEN